MKNPGTSDHRQHSLAKSAPVPRKLNLENEPALERSLRDQMQEAAEMQRSLLPDVSEPIGDYRLASLYRPCETLGGDFYDLFRGSDSVILLLADVMGHGPEAALITMLVKAVFQEIVETTQTPSDVLAKMNTRLHRITPERVYAAATVVRIQPDKSEMQLANAGLPYPFVLRCSQHELEEVRVTGFPLGLFNGRASRTYQAHELSLDPGDVLLLASDGISSVEGDNEQCFDGRRLRRTLTRLAGCDGSKVIDSLVSEALTFSRGRPLPDDINLVAISRDLRPGGC